VNTSTLEVDGSMAREVNMSGEAIRVLLVDDHAMVRQGLRSYLSTYYRDIEVVGDAGSGEEALQAVHTLSPSVVVMDINMPGLNGIEATARIKQTHPHVGVVGLSMHVDEDYRRAMTTAGATALISKGAVLEDLYDAIIKSSGASG
jgi:DNA-binding NarL/FixJ family response regulator